MKSKPVYLAAFIALLLMSVLGFAFLTDYSTRPGIRGEASQHLRDLDLSETSLPTVLRPENDSSAKQSLLFVFYHPRCPCTAATVRILERLQVRFSTDPRIIAMVYCPENEDESWIESRTTTTLSRLRGAQVVLDSEGRIGQQFGAFVSGHIMLYDEKGQLAFSGGITPYRGHEGDSGASSDLLARVNGQRTGCGIWPVFGCETGSMGAATP